MDVFKKHPLLLGFISFLVLTLPQTVESYLDLWQRYEEAAVHIDWYKWILPALPLVGLILFGILIWQGRRQTIAKEEKQGLSKQSRTIPYWLQQIPAQDLDNLKQRVKVEVRLVNFNGLADKIPYFTLHIRLVNASVFKIRLSRCEGFIQVSGSHCIPPQLNRLSELEHGCSDEVELHQSVGELGKWLVEQGAAHSKVNIVCIACQLVFCVISEGYTKEVEIPVRDGGLPCIPQGIVVVSNGHTGTEL